MKTKTELLSTLGWIQNQEKQLGSKRPLLLLTDRKKSFQLQYIRNSPLFRKGCTAYNKHDASKCGDCKTLDISQQENKTTLEI